jgi:hypothetical protein
MDQVTPVMEILLWTLPLILSILVHGVGMYVVQRAFETRGIPLLRKGGHEQLFLAAMIVLMLTTHLTEIVIWAATLIGIEAIARFRDAFYFVASTYTTLGYGEGTLAREWRLLAPMIAISGLFAFGWTTSVLFSLVTQASLLRAQRTAVSPSRK